jgi:hypothetical protein
MVSNQNLKSFDLSKELKVNYGLFYQYILTPKIHQPQEKKIRDKHVI